MSAPSAAPKDKSADYSWNHAKQLFTTSPRELYIIYLLKLLESFNYFTFTLLYPFFLTDELGVSDASTGFSLGVLGSVALLYGIIISPIIDYVGVKPCLVLSFIMSACTRLGLAFAPNKNVFFGLVYGPLSIAFSLGMPVLMIAIKKYTPRHNWGMAYSFYYTIMNVAALFSGFCLDIFTIQLKNGLGTRVLAFSNGYRSLMALASVTSAIAALVVFCLREPAAVRQEQINLMGYSDIDDTSDDECTALMSFRDRAHELGRDWLAIMKDWEFWKFMAVCLITINMRSLFRHLDFTMPKFVKRSFGCDAPAGKLYSINPLVVIITVPIFGILLNHISHFDVIHYGSYIHTTSAFWLAGFQTMWAVGLFVFQLSIGEAIWSPRWYDYSMSVAPNGREGLFVALAAAPLFFSKLPTGILSGWVLQHYCPDNGEVCPNTARAKKALLTPPPIAGSLPSPPPPPCDGKRMWLLIGVIAVTSPIMLLLFYRWLRPKPQAASISRTGSRSNDDKPPPQEIRVTAVNAEGVHVTASDSLQSGRGKREKLGDKRDKVGDLVPLLPWSQPKSD